MTTTSNYNLNMPSQEDFYNIDDINENMQTIDGTLFDIEKSTTDLSQKVGNTNDTGATQSTGTVMGKLNNIMKATQNSNPSVIRRIQRGNITSTGKQTIEINITDANKTMVIFSTNYISGSSSSHRFGSAVSLISLTNTNMTVIHGYPDQITKVENNCSYQLIEFY